MMKNLIKVLLEDKEVETRFNKNLNSLTEDNSSLDGEKSEYKSN